MTFLPRVQKLVIDSSPQLLTAVGVVGTITTAVLTGRAGFRAAQILAEQDPYADAKLKTELVWKEFIPPAVTGTLTVVSIVAADRVSSSRAAGIAAAYSLTERAFEEYRNKTADHLGAKKERVLRDEIAQDRVQAAPMTMQVVPFGADVLCFDEYSGRFFQGNMEDIKAAENLINHQIIHNTYATLTDYYSHIGLERTQFSDEVGWCSTELMKLEFSSVLKDDKPCLAIGFRTEPVRDYYNFH